jgi:hypothetical protein
MPQGRAKKIQIQLLLADLALQFFDPALLGAGSSRRRGSGGLVEWFGRVQRSANRAALCSNHHTG